MNDNDVSALFEIKIEYTNIQIASSYNIYICEKVHYDFGKLEE